ncbi:MAG: phosphotransferase family protein [Solirubrobacterales bacterium]
MNSQEEDLQRRIAAAAGPGVEVTAFAAMPGGHSGITHRATLLRGDGTVEEVVIKSAPPGRPASGRHDVLRQARVIAALGSTGRVPVAEVLFAEDGDPPFFAGELLPGVATEPLIEPELAEETAELIAARWEAAIAMLAALHATPLAELGLAEEPARTPLEELELWMKTMAAARMDDPSAADLLGAEMTRTAPEAGSAALVHGDFRLGNIVFEGAKPRGLIDWEIWSVAHPLIDLAWFVQFTDPENYPGLSRTVPGTPSAEEVVDRYLAAAGQEGDDLAWFLALGCFKLAAIQAHNRRRHFDGRHHDPLQEQLGPSIDRLLQRGLTVLAKP